VTPGRGTGDLWLARWRDLELRCTWSEVRTSRRFGTDDEIEAFEMRVERSDSSEPFMIQKFATLDALFERSAELRESLVKSGWTAIDA
jgi:hypothetical protein